MAIQNVTSLDISLSARTNTSNSSESKSLHVMRAQAKIVPSEKSSSQPATTDFQDVSGIAPRYGSIERQVSDTNDAALSFRNLDMQLERYDSRVRKMGSAVEAILKNFPPFPPGSDEREQLLKSYASLRKQIESLTIPPEPTLLPENLLPKPAYEELMHVSDVALENIAGTLQNASAVIVDFRAKMERTFHEDVLPRQVSGEGRINSDFTASEVAATVSVAIRSEGSLRLSSSADASFRQLI